MNEKGRAQARSLAPLMRNQAPERLWSSDLSRALETAALSLPGREARPTPALREIFLGEGEGLTREEISALWPDRWVSWGDLRWPSYETRFPGGESRREGIERMLQLLNTEPRRGSVAFYTHGLLLRSFAQWAAHLEEPRYTTPNCCVFEFAVEFEDLHFESPPNRRPRLLEIHCLPEESLTL